jgi:hypothetical protein
MLSCFIKPIANERGCMILAAVARKQKRAGGV